MKKSERLAQEVKAAEDKLEQVRRKLEEAKEEERKRAEAPPPESLIPEKERALLIAAGFEFWTRPLGEEVTCTSKSGAVRLFYRPKQKGRNSAWNAEYRSNNGEMQSGTKISFRAAVDELYSELNDEQETIVRAERILRALQVADED